MSKCIVYTIEELRNIKKDREMVRFIKDLERSTEESNKLLADILKNLNEIEE